MSNKMKALSLAMGLLYLPFGTYYGYLLLQKVGGTDLLWFLFWVTIPMAVASGILSKLAEWEE